MNRWPHQLFGVDRTLDAIDAGQTRICVTTPTGGGKTRTQFDLADRFLEQRLGVTMYTHRKMLLEQTSESLENSQVNHGIRAAGYERTDHLFQIASIQTEHSRSIKRKTTELHPSKLVLFDEGHLHTGPVAQEIRRRHLADGAVTVDFTATPIGMKYVCDELIVAGTNSSLRECGALIPCQTFGPDEPDLKGLKAQEGEEITEKQAKSLMMRDGLFGRVWENFERINPEHKPTVLFAPGVAESFWFAQQFTNKGVRWAHIDGEDVWVDNCFQKSNREIREQILADNKSGRIVGISNRFVLREGIDCPWWAHGILATVFGSLQSFLQAVGRLLRSFPGLESVTLQDHGGNWWRHGSPNADRHWELDYTASMVYGLRAESLRQKKEPEPWRCPACSRIVLGRRCKCGHEAQSNRKVRPVITSDGTLREMTGDIFRPRRIASPSLRQVWEKMYWRSRTEKGERTFRAAMALFAYENHYCYPDPSWPFMPTNDRDFFALVKDVPRERLQGVAGDAATVH